MSKQTRKKSPKSPRPVKPTAKAAVKPAAKAKTAEMEAKTTASQRSRPKEPAKAKPAVAGLAKTADKPTTKPPEVPGLTEGAKAPTFKLPRDGGGTASLADYAGKQLVLFFYPRADTPGCTKEAIDFTRLSKDFATSGTAVLGVSADPVKAQDSFRDKHKLSVPLMSDERHEMLEAYGAWGEKSLYGRKFLGIIRSTVLIGKDGRIARIWRNVKVEGHADAVLAAAKAL